jgi:NAD(P)H-dependent FMN reductase
MTINIGIVVGSARQGSFNRALSDLAAARLAAHGAAVTMIDLTDYPLPVYAPSIHGDDIPARARDLQAVLRAQDGLLFATPEYNASISGLLKNAIDWASISLDGAPPLALLGFRGKAAAVMAASTGPFGGLRALAHLRQILSALQMLVIPEQLSIPGAHTAYAEDGSLREALPATLLDGMAASLVRVATALRG